MTAVTPGIEELAVACLRRLARCNIENPGQREMAADDILSTLQKIDARATKLASDPDAMNERRAADDALLAANVREACAKIAEPWPGHWLDETSTDIDRAVVAVRTEIGEKIRAVRP